MKASLKFREEQKPLIKAKIPISILGLPFQSSLIAGDSKELTLGLSTFFDSGPSFRVSYRPNDAFNPFSVTVKSGIGHFGSPSNAPMTMSAEFNLIGDNPRFMIHFKPNFGDFCVRKSQTNVVSDFTGEEDDGERKMTVLPLRKTVECAVRGMELGAKTSLPIRNGAVLRLRWGARFPADGLGLGLGNWVKDQTGRMLPRGVPLLSLNKIGIEHVAVVGGSESGEVAETCFGMKREVEMLRFENDGLGKAMEELRAEFGRKSDGDGDGEVES